MLQSTCEELQKELDYTRVALSEAYEMLRQSLDNNLLLANKLNNAQARWLGKQ